jgi:hypothetical protein
MQTGSPVGEASPLAAHFREPSARLRSLFKSAAGPASNPPQTLLDPSRFMTFARHFLGQRRDGIALSPRGKCRGSLPLFSRFPFPRQARSGHFVFSMAHSLAHSALNSYGSPIQTRHDADPLDISYDASCDLKRSISRWASAQLKRGRSLCFHPGQIDPTLLGQMDHKLRYDHPVL